MRAASDSAAVGSNPIQLTVFANILLFQALKFASGSELWRSDGTSVGTFQIADIYSGTVGSFPEAMTTIGAFSYFAASNPVMSLSACAITTPPDPYALTRYGLFARGNVR